MPLTVIILHLTEDRTMIDSKHDFSGDIDLFGDDSLFRYLNRSVTGPGRSILAGWLSDPYDLREQVTERQEAVRELAGKLAWRQHFMANGLDKPLNEDEIKDLTRWLNEEDNFFLFAVCEIILFHPTACCYHITSACYSRSSSADGFWITVRL